MNDETVAKLRDRAQHLIELKGSASWPVVKQILEEKIQGKVNVLVGGASLSDTELHYGRGYIQGMKVMVALIEDGEKEFSKAMKAAKALEGAEGA